MCRPNHFSSDQRPFVNIVGGSVGYKGSLLYPFRGQWSLDTNIRDMTRTYGQ